MINIISHNPLIKAMKRWDPFTKNGLIEYQKIDGIRRVSVIGDILRDAGWDDRKLETCTTIDAIRAAAKHLGVSSSYAQLLHEYGCRHESDVRRLLTKEGLHSVLGHGWFLFLAFWHILDKRECPGFIDHIEGKIKDNLNWAMETVHLDRIPTDPEQKDYNSDLVTVTAFGESAAATPATTRGSYDLGQHIHERRTFQTTVGYGVIQWVLHGLAHYASREICAIGRNPEFAKKARYLRYFVEDVEQWVKTETDKANNAVSVLNLLHTPNR